jgi:hypothetical protein
VRLVERSEPSEIGARAEAAVASALVRAGRLVFLPAFAAHSRVDLVYLDADRPVRVQCKTARVLRGVLVFKTCSYTANAPRTYSDQIDEFGVFAPTTGLVYLVPLAGLPDRACSLRLGPARNGQRVGVRWAADYELGPP